MGLRDSAVLVPVLLEDDDLKIIMCQRSPQLQHHGGQIAFPGGKFEIADQSLSQTALRESFEELGILPQLVEVLGELDETWTPSGYRIHAFGGWLSQRPDFQICTGEIANLVEVSVRQLLEPSRFSEEYLERGDTRYRMVNFHLDEGLRIWGATARILYRFLQCVCSFQVDRDEPWDVPTTR